MHTSAMPQKIWQCYNAYLQLEKKSRSSDIIIGNILPLNRYLLSTD